MKNRSALFILVLPALAALMGGCPKPPAAPDKPWGPASAPRNTVVACSTRAADTGGGEVAFQFDWGDGTQSVWSALQPAGAVFGDTHTYTVSGAYGVRARARTSGSSPGEWSEEFIMRIEVGEGELLTRFAFRDPEEPEDSADFSLNTFALGPGGRSYIGCEWALIFRAPEGRRDKEFITRDLDGFFGAPSLSESGVLYAVCENDTLYALSTDGGRRWTAYIGDEVYATPALGADGAIFIQTVSESLYAFNADGSRRWSLQNTGVSSPVIGTDGTVYIANDEGRVRAVDPGTGAEKNFYALGSNAIQASPALDPGRTRLYAADEEGNLVALNLGSFTDDWSVNVGSEPSSPVIGADGTVYIGGGGKLHAINPATGSVGWSFQPPLAGSISTPAVSDQGYIYVAVVAGRKLAAVSGVDSLYGVNPNGTRRWAYGLDYGDGTELSSAPKLDANGYIYIGNGYFAWIVRGLGGPAASPWPMFQRDGANTGRARN